jgi:micrococcal nuclease
MAMMLAACACSNAPAYPEGFTTAIVTRVVDGDTVVVQVRGEESRVRYIGIDTPDVVNLARPAECFGDEASDRNRELVEGKTVGLEMDVSETDRYGRLLRYVWLDGRMINAVLVEEGYATAERFPPDVKRAELLAGLEAAAQSAGLGLWGACETP